MTSTILSFFKLFGTRASRTTTNPNSRAAVSLWRRFFELKQQEEEGRCLEDIAARRRALEERGFHAAAGPAVQSETAVHARADILREHYRELMGRNGHSARFQQLSSNNNDNSNNNNRPNENPMAMPNFAVPTSNRLDEDYMYLAQ